MKEKREDGWMNKLIQKNYYIHNKLLHTLQVITYKINFAYTIRYYIYDGLLLYALTTNILIVVISNNGSQCIYRNWAITSHWSV